MSAADLMARIDAARGEQQRASDLLAEARGMSKPILEPPQEGLLDILSGDEDGFDWDDGRDVGGLFGELFGGAVGSSLAARGGAALGFLAFGPVGAVAGGLILGAVGHVVGSEGGRALGGELGEEIEDFLEGRGFGTGDEDSRATFGHATTNDYRTTFFEANPGVDPSSTTVHHAVEQQVLRRYPGLVSEAEMHSLENLRGIPNDINSQVHLSEIRREWNRFYRENPNPTREHLLDKATEIDNRLGHLFNPPVR